MRLLLLLCAAVLAASCSSPSSSPEGEPRRPAASPLNSRVALVAGSVAADGTTPATVTVTVRDDAGAAIAGAPVLLAYAGSGTVTALQPTTDATGTARFAVTAPSPTVGAVTATVDAAPLGGAPTLAFHGCEYGGFVNGACAPPPFVLLPPAVPASWGGVKPTYFALGDLDGNGLDDVVVADSVGQAVQVLVAYGDGRFAPRARFDAGGSVNGVVVADVTGDAIADVVTIANAGALGDRLTLLPGTGDGTLRAPLATPIPNGASLEGVADLDGDGDLDLIARALGGVGVLLNHGAGTFGPLTRFATPDLYWTPTALTIADVDGDGRPDAITAWENAGEIEVRLGVGDGTFGAPSRFATGPAPVSIATGDVDGDGHLDAVTGNRGASGQPGGVSVLLGSGDGGFGAHSEYAAGRPAQSVALTDLDGDGLADVLTANGGASVSLLRATGGGALAYPLDYESAGISWKVAAARLDADAIPDLVVLDYDSGTISGTLGRAGGAFAATRKPPYTRLPSSVSAGDVTGDGRIDLVADAGTTQDVTVSVGKGDGTFDGSFSVAVPGDPSYGRVVTVGDLDGAGGADVIVLNKATRELSVLLSSGGSLVLDATYAVSGRTEAAAIGDLDEDGLPDVVVANPVDTVNPGTLSVFLGTGGGALSAETVLTVGGYPWAVALGDVNGDTHLDVVLMGLYPSELRVHLGDGAGSFGPAAPYAGAAVSGSRYGKTSVALADLDHDGDLDAVADDGTNFVQVFVNGGDGTFGVPVAYPVGNAPYGVALGDLNGDGDLDAVTPDHDSQTLTVLEGLGDATFADGIAFSGYQSPNQAVVANLNGDAYADVAVADWGASTLPISLGSAAGLRGWTPVALGERPSDLAIRDVDGDGIQDLVAIAFERSGFAVALGRGDGTFARAVSQTIGGYPASVTVRDVNGDAKLDAVVTHIPFKTPEGVVVVPGGLGILLGNGDGTFGAEALYPAGDEARRVALGDVNGDGRVDAVVPGATSALLLTQNSDGSFAAPVALPTAPPPEALVSPDPLTPSELPSCVDVALADVDGDGDLDLLAANATPVTTPFPINEVALLLGNGDGTFQPRVAFATISPVNLLVTDLDADGDLDVAVATNWATLDLLVGDGTGGFTRVSLALPMGGISIAAGDLDKDGLPDLVTTSGTRAFAAHRNAGAAFESFTFAVRDAIRDLDVADLDGDGRPDVAVLTTGGVFPLLTRLP
jgi:hypothetical protein